MGRWRMTALVLLVGLFSFGLFYALASKQPQPPTSASACDGFCVALTENGAQPAELSVPAGSFVQFNSADGKSHNISLGKGGEEHDHGGLFYSGEFGPDEAWRVQFEREGSFFFHDHQNPDINVLVVVYTPGKDYKIN